MLNLCHRFKGGFWNLPILITHEILALTINWLQWRNRLAHGTYRQYKELCRGCEFEPHLEQHVFERGYLLTYRKILFIEQLR